ncbi:protein FAR1-RELATED SEQUENCE 5-like [Vicia villosa]|uniref:protein FAR1-RELATED SEQUENCE 5-like n=1 Tax=Vicia villosa TaxID=3911 RepID=UPI00273C2122|nr:protein FAR1-RELATED SEQUENCE 5-like [Vicia villosa]
MTRDRKKCACLFKLRVSCRINDLWRFSVICGLHNHTLETKLHGHPIACRLSRQEKDVISELSIIKVAPRNILADLKRKKLNIVSNIKQVCNEHYNLKVEKMGLRSEIQHLLKLLGDNQYVSSFRTCEDNVTVRDIFWTHPKSIKMLNAFPTVLVIDSTYKTNKYRFPLLEIIGMTSMDKTYSVGFAFLECEKEDNFTWALGICKTLLVDQNNMPRVIVTDQDTLSVSYKLKCEI